MKKDKADTDEGTPHRSWTRWHGSTHVASVFQYGPEQFSAHGAAHGEDSLPKSAIRTLEEAQRYADQQVQMRWPHDCATQRCTDWIDSQSK
jgi:hypothetical protein